MSDYGTPEGVTAQEIFNRTWRRFVVYRAAPSTNHKGICVYRGVSGRACAVGIHVTDAECADWDRRPNSTLDSIASTGLLPDRLKPHRALLRELQKAHDDWDHEYNRTQRRESLIVIAEEFNLTVPS